MTLLCTVPSGNEYYETPIYLDNHATTRMDPRVLDAMRPISRNFRQRGQPEPQFGWEAEEAVEKARKQIADLIGATPKEIVFTSGATESTTWRIKGVAEMYAEKGNHIITAATEHKAVLDTCKTLEKQGYPGHLFAGAGRWTDRSRSCSGKRSPTRRY